MKITMITLGSTGDVRPYMLLGRELHERGHEVTIAAFAPFQGMIEEAGMSFYPISGDVVDMMGRLLQPDAVGVRYLKEFEKGIRDIAPMLLDDLLHCAEGAEAIVCTFFGTMFYSIAEKYDIPCIQTQYFPMDPCKDMPISSAPFRKLGKWWNVLSYRIGYLLISALEHRYLSDWRKENDMAKRRVRLRPDYDVKGKQVPVIYAMSPTLVPRPEDWADNIHMSGFWWDERPVDYTPDPALAEFLRAGDEPVYIGFGSMVSGDMGELAEIIRQAETVIDGAARFIRNEDPFPQPKITLGDKISSGIVNRIFYPMFVHAKKFYATDRCISCGKCAEVCPLSNIRLDGKKPVWSDHCTHCMACICRCPAQAIEYGKKSLGKPRYHFEAL